MSSLYINNYKSGHIKCWDVSAIMMLQIHTKANIQYVNLQKPTKSKSNPVYGYIKNYLQNLLFIVRIFLMVWLVIRLLLYYDKYASRNQWLYFHELFAVY